MRTSILIGVAVVALVAFSGCGKTIEELKKVGHGLVDAAAGIYEDVKDNVEEVKKVVEGEDEQK